MRRLTSLAIAAWLSGICGASPLAAEETPPTSEEAPAPEQTERPPITQIEGAAPTETPKERLERFKRERGAGSDKPFEGFAVEAEREMQRRRDAAIGGTTARAVAAPSAAQLAEDYEGAVERLQDRLSAFAGSWGGTPCMLQEPFWSTQDDWTPHRRLAPEDFRSGQPDNLRLAVATREGKATAFLATIFTCIVTPNVVETRPGVWTASLSNVRYLPVLSRRESYLNPEAGPDSYEFRHEQLHFDLARQLARWLNQNQDAIRAKLTSQGGSETEALGRLQLELGRHMQAVQRDARALETAYDRETRHGHASSVQTEWSFRIQDGLEAIAKETKLESRAWVK